MILRRGFKAEAERIAQEVRVELGLSATDQLDGRALGDHLGVPLIGLSALATRRGGIDFRAFFQRTDPDTFSALTIFNGTARLILHNDAHHPHRQASNICHEVSHCILEHNPAPLLSETGCRHWNDTLESEADWLAGVLLVPRDGGLILIKRDWSIQEIAEHYGVSEHLCRWRLHQTGVMQQAKRLMTK